jgi:predicted permease
MLSLFVNNLLPVFLAAGAGYVLVRRVKLDSKPVSQVAFFVFAPCLVFQIIVDSELPLESLLRTAGFCAVSLLGLAGVTAVVARAMGCPRPLIAAIVLVVLLPNAGNYGLSVNRFAFGEEGLVQAGIYFIVSSVLTFTVGVLIASLGRSGLRETLIGFVRVPAIWSVSLALVLVSTGTHLPLPLARTVELLSQASIPTFLLLLGMQLAGQGISGPWGPLVLASGARLVAGVAVGLGLASLMGLDGVARQAAILQSGMPAAIISIVLAVEYDVEPAFVTSVVVTTTILSPLTLTPLLAYLGA